MLLVDAIVLKIREGQVGNRQVYLAMGIASTATGHARAVRLAAAAGPRAGKDRSTRSRSPGPPPGRRTWPQTVPTLAAVDAGVGQPPGSPGATPRYAGLS